MVLETWCAVLADRRAIDLELAAGAHPDRRATLALRARQLQRRSTRRSLASALETLVETARQPPVLMAGLRPRNADVEAASHDLLALAERLRAPEPIAPRGAAIAHLLLTSPGGPVYSARAGRTIGNWAAEALAAMEPCERLVERTTAALDVAGGEQIRHGPTQSGRHGRALRLPVRALALLRRLGFG